MATYQGSARFRRKLRPLIPVVVPVFLYDDDPVRTTVTIPSMVAEFRMGNAEFSARPKVPVIAVRVSVPTDPNVDLFGTGDGGCRNRKGCDRG